MSRSRMDTYAAAEEARRILLHHDQYRSMSGQELGMRIDVPLELGHADLVEGRMFLSWMRPEEGPDASLARQAAGVPPLYEDWAARGPLLWVVDMAAMPGTSGTWVGRQLSKFLATRSIAAIGETVVFRRHCGRRFGWATVRG